MPVISAISVQKWIQYDGSNGQEIIDLIVAFPISSWSDTAGVLTVDTGSLSGVVTMNTGDWTQPGTVGGPADEDFRKAFALIP